MGQKPAKKRYPRGINSRNGILWVSFSYDSSHRRESLHMPDTPGNIKHAKKILAEVQGVIAAGDMDEQELYAEYFPRSRRAKREGAPGTRTFGECHAIFMKLKTRSATTKDGYMICYQRLRKPLPGDDPPPPITPDTPMTDLTEDWINMWKAHASEKYCPSYINDCLVQIRGACGVAMRGGTIRKDPTAHVDNVPNPPRGERIDPYEDWEVQKLIEANPGAPANVIQFWANMGMRNAEVFGLKWSAVFFEKNLVHISSTLVKGEQKSTKTNQERYPLINARAMEALKNQRALTQLKSDYVFLDPESGGPWTTREFDLQLWKWCKVAGVRRRPPKNFRQTFISHMLNHGMDPWAVAKHVGHTDFEMMRKHYAKWLPPDKHREDLSKYAL